MTGTIPAVETSLHDRYTIEREIGRGGMAVVHLAEEKKHARKVAIKILKREFTASLGAERFLREIGIAARLSHPHIVPLIDSGESDGQLYYVSPYIPDGSLRDRIIFEKRLPPLCCMVNARSQKRAALILPLLYWTTRSAASPHLFPPTELLIIS